MLRKSAETLEHSLAAKAKDADRREREYEKAKRKEREKAAEKAKGLEKAMREQEREFREREASASPVVVDLVSRAEKAERTVADLAEEFKKVASATSLNNTMLTEHDMVERERTVWELEMRCAQQSVFFPFFFRDIDYYYETLQCVPKMYA
ncbi:hypothetical protein DIPPA_04093 [Diplonema papillatum]|nr:hypothetical protein DIPPA_04093 [Diplonema papillatum]